MPKILRYTLYIIPFFLLLAAGCHKREKQPEPCVGVQAPKPDFMMRDRLGPRYFNTATIYDGRTLYLKSVLHYDSCSWTIGNNGRVWHGDSFQVSFIQPYGKMLVRLIGKRKPEKCFPKDDGMDTIEKTINVISGGGSYGYNGPLLGNWLIYDSANPKVVYTELKILQSDSAEKGRYDTYFYHLLPGCDSGYMGSGLEDLSYNAFLLQDSYAGCYGASIVGYLDENDTNKITLEYTTLPNYNWTTIKHFTRKGVRMQ